MAVPEHFIVLVPGFTGSKLKEPGPGGKTVWVDFGSIPKLPWQWDDWVEQLAQKMTYPNPLEPEGIVDEVVFIPPWIKQRHYQRLISALEGWGYEAGRNLYTFAHDWRQDNRLSAQQLAASIQGWKKDHPPEAKAWIIAHSNGGLVARWYIEKEGGADHVGKLMLMGSPWDGTPKAMSVLFNGLDILFLRRFNAILDIATLTRDLARTWAPLYQLIPYENPFLQDVNNQSVDPFENNSWLETREQKQLLADGLRFSQELGKTLSVATYCFFGNRSPTPTFGRVYTGAQGIFKEIKWEQTDAGDGTVPWRSAAHPQAVEKLAFYVGHGDIYVHDSVLAQLEYMLILQYQEDRDRAFVRTDRLSIGFEPEKEVYEPGETIGVWATVETAAEEPEEREAISGATVTVTLDVEEWSPLPAAEGVEAPAPLEPVHLWEGDKEGRYEEYEGGDILVAPDVEGYYVLKAMVDVEGHDPVYLEELISVEGTEVPSP